jgi:hypothetical protein
MSSVPFLSAVSFASPRRCTSGAGMTPGSGAGLTLLVRSSVMACLLPKRNCRVPDLNREERDSALAELADQLNARNGKAKI